MLERAADFLQVRFYVRKNGAPLRRGVPNSTASLFQWIVVFNRCCVAGQKDVSFRTRDDRSLPPRHQTIAFELLVRCEVHVRR